MSRQRRSPSADAKTSPLRDVAGLLRSIDYAGATLSDRKDVGALPIDAAQRDQFIANSVPALRARFLRAYWEAAGSSGDATARALLDLFLIEKAAYEIGYEVGQPADLDRGAAGRLGAIGGATHRQGSRRSQWLTYKSKRLASGSSRPSAPWRRAMHGDPFAVLGPHDTADGRVIRAFLPGAVKVEVLWRSDGASAGAA